MSNHNKQCVFCGKSFLAVHMAVKYCSLNCKYLEKLERARHRVATGHPHIAVDDMTIFKPICANDAVKIERKQIESPVLAAMPFSFTDKAHRMTYFFENEAKYNRFIAKQHDGCTNQQKNNL